MVKRKTYKSRNRKTYKKTRKGGMMSRKRKVEDVASVNAFKIDIPNRGTFYASSRTLDDVIMDLLPQYVKSMKDDSEMILEIMSDMRVGQTFYVTDLQIDGRDVYATGSKTRGSLPVIVSITRLMSLDEEDHI